MMRELILTLISVNKFRSYIHFVTLLSAHACDVAVVLVMWNLVIERSTNRI